MNSSMVRKFALVSHILPPSPSGQAMVISGLLREFPLSSYCLVSREIYNHSSGDLRKLAGTYYHTTVPRFVSWTVCIRPNILREVINSLFVILVRARQITKIIKSEQCKVIIACTGDLYDIPSAYLASKWGKADFVPYMFDDYVFQWMGKQRLFAKWIEPICIKGSSRIIVPNEFMAKEYLRRYDVDSIVVRNPCNLPNLDELDNTANIFNLNEISIVYTGSIYHAHYDAFRNLLTAIKKLSRADVKLHLYTSQPKSLLESEGISGEQVVFHEHVCQSQIPQILRHADILFLPLAFNSPIPEVIRTSAPGKMGEYLSVGKPILVHAPGDSFVSWYFKKYDCGIVIDDNDPNNLVEAIKSIICDKANSLRLGERARKQAEVDFDLEAIRKQFSTIVNS